MRPQPHGSQRLRFEFDCNGGRAALAFELQIHEARLLAKRRHDLIPDVIQRIQILAEHLDGYLRRASGQAFADAVAEEGHNLALDAGVLAQYLAQFVLGLGFVHRGVRFEFDMKFALMRSPGILAQLRTAHLLFDRCHIGQPEHVSRNSFAEPEHLLKRRAGYGTHDLHHEVTFAKLRHEGSAEKRHRRDGGHAAREQHSADELDMFFDPQYGPDLSRLHPRQPAGFRVQIAVSQQERAHRRSCRHRHEQRSGHRENEGERQRPHEMALDAGGKQLRQEHRDHDQGCVDDRSPHFERRFSNDVQPRQRARRQCIRAHAPQNVLDADDGVIHQYAEGDGEASQGHGVQRLPHAVKHEHGREQGEGDRREGDQCRAYVAQKQVQHHEDQHRGNRQGVLEVSQGAFDEIRRAVQGGVHGDALRFQGGREVRQGLFDGQGGRQGICTELTRERQHDAGFAHDQRVARPQPRSLFDFRHVAYQYRHAIANRDDRLSDGGQIRFRSGRSQQYALGGEVDEPRAVQRQSAACGIGHIEQRHVIARQFIGVRLDLYLPNIAAEHEDVRDAGYGEQSGFDDPVGGITQCIAIRRVRLQSDLEQIHRARHQRREFRCSHSRGQGASDLGQAFGNSLARNVNVHVVGERHDHHGQARYRFGTKRGQTRRAVDGALDAFGDQFLYLLRRESRRLGLDIDLRGNEFREHVQRRTHDAPATQQQRQYGQRRYTAEMTYTQGYQPPHDLLRFRAGINLARQEQARRRDYDRIAGLDPVLDEIAIGHRPADIERCA